MTPCTKSTGESNERAGEASRDERRDASASDAEEGGSVAGLTAVTTPAAAAQAPVIANEVSTRHPHLEPETRIPGPAPRHPLPDTPNRTPET
jgi:hypothetical protein